MEHLKNKSEEKSKTNHMTHQIMEIDGEEYVIVLLDFSDVFGVTWTLVAYSPVNYFLGPITKVRWGIAASGFAF